MRRSRISNPSHFAGSSSAFWVFHSSRLIHKGLLKGLKEEITRAIEGKNH